jgi:hypothetical protein
LLYRSFDKHLNPENFLLAFCPYPQTFSNSRYETSTSSVESLRNPGPDLIKQD